MQVQVSESVSGRKKRYQNISRTHAVQISALFNTAAVHILAVQWNYLVSVLSWRPRGSRSPRQPNRSLLPVMPSRPHRPLLPLGNRRGNSTNLANATILIILIKQRDTLINGSYQEGNSHTRKQA